MAAGVTNPTFVGRDEETERLVAALEGALGGDPAAVLILGEAGVGKTRLVDEFASRARSRGALVLQGACLPFASSPIPFVPLTAAVRDLVRALPPADLRAVLGGARTELARLMPELAPDRSDRVDRPDRSDRPDRAGRVAGPDAGDARLGRARLFETVLGVTERLGRRTPVVLVLEDLQWADRSTLDLLVFLVASIRSGRIVLVATCRTEGLHDRPELLRLVAELERRPNVERIQLRAFDRQTLAHLAEAITGRAPTRREIDDLLARTGGNAFLVEQLLVGAVPEGRSVPEGVRDIIGARLSSLSDRARSVLRTAALAGGPVPSAVLAAVAGDPREDEAVQSAILEAVSAGILVVEEDPGGEQLIGFRHELLRELALGQPLRSEGRAIHARYAAALAQRGGVDPATSIGIADHWYEADDAERALPAAIEAAEAAEQLSAFADAALRYERALELWDRVRAPDDRLTLDRGAILGRAAEALLHAGEPERAIARLVEARADPLVAGDPDRSHHIRARLRVALWQAGRRDEAIADAEELLGELGPDPPSAARAVAEAHLGALLLEVGEIDRSLEVARKAADSARAAGVGTEEALALGTIGSDLIELGQLSDGVEQIRAAWHRSIQLGRPFGIGLAYGRLVAALDRTGRYEEAVAVGSEGLEIGRRLGLERSLAPFVAAALGDALERLGRWKEARSLCLDALESLLPDPARLGLAVVAARIGVRTGRMDEAERLLAGLRAPSDAPEAWALAAVRVELAAADDATARSTVDEAADDLRSRRAWHASIGDLLVAGARLDADAAERAHVTRDAVAGQAAAARIERALKALASMRTAATEEVAALVLPYELAVRAERARARAAPRSSDAAAWAATRQAWLERRVPYQAAYAALRQAEVALAARGSRDDAESLLRAAHATAAELGAEPLRLEVESLAKRARLSLAPATQNATTERPAGDALGLTPREREILGYVAAGWTNRQIGEALFISPKTASVHVSNILGKLGVEGRVHAATIAVRMGLGVPQRPRDAK